jgi:hypothetical protein
VKILCLALAFWFFLSNFSAAFPGQIQLLNSTKLMAMEGP